MPLTLSLTSTVAFEPIGKVTHIFFDAKNEQIFSVRSGGATGIQCRGFDNDKSCTFRLSEDQGPICTIKLSPDQKILAIQRNKPEVEFITIDRTGPTAVLDEDRKFSQPCKSKSANLLGFSWTGTTEITFFTDNGLEVYNVLVERRVVKSVRNHSQQIAWYYFCPQSNLVAISPSVVTPTLHLVHIKEGYVYKLPKIEGDNVEAKEKDVVVCNIYSSQTYVAIIAHPKSNESSSEVHLYAVSIDQATVNKTYVMKIPIADAMMMSTVDDMIVVHHQSSGTSFIFDVTLAGDFNAHLTPLGTCHIEQPEDPRKSPLESRSGASAQPSSSSSSSSYSPHWISFQPDILIDVNMGAMWKIKVSLSAKDISQTITDLKTCVAFLQQRQGAKSVLLQVLIDHFRQRSTRLSLIGDVLDIIVEQYSNYLHNQLQQNMALPASSFSSTTSGLLGSGSSANAPKKPESKVILDQSDLYTHVFSVLADEDATGKSPRPNAILIEYFRSLAEKDIRPEYFLQELLINILVRQKAYFQLHQQLQYNVITDSKPVACLLLSLENVYEPAYQLAMDMFFRLKDSNEEICEILLSKKHVLPALRYAHDKGLDHIPARKFLDAALEQKNDSLYYNVYTFLQSKNRIPENGYETYKQHFESKFASTEGDKQ